jgi:AcrR family transcriptional regulator
MNSSFLNIQKEKRNNILNAGYKVFGTHSYKKASMSSLAEEAQISKALLFYYFKNKKELYFYLFRSALEYLANSKEKQKSESQDFFEIIDIKCRERILMMRQYPYIFQFVAMAYYEPDKEVKDALSNFTLKKLLITREDELSRIDRTKFRNPYDVEVLYDIIIDFSEGYMAKHVDALFKQPEQVLKDAAKMFSVLRRNFYREEFM